MRRMLSLLSFVTLCAVPVLAQQSAVAPIAPDGPEFVQAPRPAQTPAPAPRPPATTQPQPPQAPPAPVPPPAPSRVVEMGVQQRPVPTDNVKIDLTITDSFGTGTRKTMTLLIAESRSGRIRSVNSMSQNAPNIFTINVDARPVIRKDGRIELDMTIEYVPNITSDPPTRPANINESLTVLVPDGKPTLVSQSADPSTDRKVTVEVTATVVK